MAENGLFRPFFQNFPNRIFRNAPGVLTMRFGNASALVALMKHFFFGGSARGRRVIDGNDA